MQSVWNGFFGGEKKCKSHHILRGKKQSQKSPYLDREFVEVTKTMWDLRKFLSSIEIWLIPLVDGHQLSSAFFFFSLWISAKFQPLLGQCYEPKRHRALIFVRDYLGCGYFITSTSIPFVIFSVDYATVGIIPLSTSTINPNSFCLFCCRM
jgi:hypothetical protein